VIFCNALIVPSPCQRIRNRHGWRALCRYGPSRMSTVNMVSIRCRYALPCIREARCPASAAHRPWLSYRSSSNFFFFLGGGGWISFFFFSLQSFILHCILFFVALGRGVFFFFFGFFDFFVFLALGGRLVICKYIFLAEGVAYSFFTFLSGSLILGGFFFILFQMCPSSAKPEQPVRADVVGIVVLQMLLDLRNACSHVGRPQRPLRTQPLRVCPAHPLRQ